jgi:hypothetical protein
MFVYLFSHELNLHKGQRLMQFNHDANQIRFDRQAEIRIWLFRNGLTFVELGRRMGVTGNAVLRMLRQPRLSIRRYEQLLAVGVPAELLPHAEDVRRGPKLKIQPCEQEAVTAP